MNDWTRRELRDLLRTLANRGVQVSHNRGRLFVAPFKKLTEAEHLHLREHKDDVIDLLRNEGFDPRRYGRLVAPLPPEEGSYAGGMPRKPWDYEVAVMIPTLGCIDLLKAAVRCWRNQHVSPYFIIVDTGSDYGGVCEAEYLRSYDLEVHYISAHGWRHSSSPVSAALDLAFAVCQTNHMLLTHEDVFAKHSCVLSRLLEDCDVDNPVVGYQMSKRIGSEEWRQNVSHTCTMLHMPTVRKHRLTWNLLTALEEDQEVEQRYLGWPDTETQFGRSMKAAGITPTFLGPESNASVYETDHVVHWRSAPSVRHYLPEQRDRRHPGLDAWLSETMARGCAAPLPQFAERDGLPAPSAN